MAIRIAITNKKGGIGKSTTALALTAALKYKGYKVLMIDTDPQRNTSNVYRAEIHGVPTLYDIIFGKRNSNKQYTASECVQTTEYGDIIASDDLLQNADYEVNRSPRMYKYISRALKDVDSDYDFIILDTPPNTGVLVGNALMAADYIITPCTCDGFGLQGIVDFYELIQEFMEDNENLKYLGLLIVKYKNRQRLTRDIEQNVLKSYAHEMNTRVFETKIRESVRCQEAQTLNLSLFDYAKNSTTANDYMEFTEEILKILNMEKINK